MLYNEKYYSVYRCNMTELPCMSQYFLDLFVVLQSHDGGTIQSLGSVLHLQQMKLVLDLRVRSRIALTLALWTWMDNNLELCNSFLRMMKASL